MFNEKIFNKLLEQNYFQLFQLEAAYTLDNGYLQQQLRELQQQFHPDNFTSQDPTLLAKSLQLSGLINQAYTTLSQPLLRAIYLLEIGGTKVDLVHDTKFSSEFLLRQIELREQIAEADTAGDLATLEQVELTVKAEIRRLECEVANLFGVANYPALIELIKQLAFYTKLEQLINNIIAQL